MWYCCTRFEANARVIQWLPVGAVGSVRQGLKESGGPRDVKGDLAGAGRAGKEAWRVMWPRYVNSCNAASCRCACCCWCMWCRMVGIARGRARWRLSSRSARLLWQREQSLSSARGDSRIAVWKMVVRAGRRFRRAVEGFGREWRVEYRVTGV